MKNVLFLIYAGTESHESMGRVTNALVMAKEFKEEGHNIEIIFDGAGTEWVPELKKESHDLNPMYEAVKEDVESVCEFCAGAFKVETSDEDPIAGGYEGHPSMTKYLEKDYEILTF